MDKKRKLIESYIELVGKITGSEVVRNLLPILPRLQIVAAIGRGRKKGTIKIDRDGKFYV